MEIVIYGYFGKGNLGDEALAEAWRRALSGLGEVRTAAPPRLPGGEVVIFTGEPLQDRTSRRSLLFYAAAIRAGALRGRVCLGAVGVDLRSGWRRLLPGILRRVDYISVRDPRSRAVLSSLGIPAVEARDPALLLPPPPGGGRGPVLVNLVPSLPPGVRREALGLARRAAAALGRGLVGIAMDPGDVRAMEGLEVLAPRSPREALEAIGEASLVVGARLHALEFSLLAGTPFVAVPYAPKVEAFLDLLARDIPGGVPRIPGGTWERVFGGEYRRALGRARARLIGEAEEGMGDVVGFLRGLA